MAQLNITLNQEEILELLQDSRPDAFKNLLQESLNGVLKAESAEQLRAEPYERTEERTDSRNGTRDRPLVTRLGRIELKVPRHRNVPFKTLVFDNYKRSSFSYDHGRDGHRRRIDRKGGASHGGNLWDNFLQTGRFGGL